MATSGKGTGSNGGHLPDRSQVQGERSPSGKPVAGERPAMGDGQEPGAADLARLRERVLAGVAMVDRKQACGLLGLSGTDPSAAMRRREGRGEVFRLTVGGRAAYPSFQFDAGGRRVLPAMGRIVAAKPPGWSGFRLLHWLTRPHLGLGRTPAEALASDGDAVLEAFRREAEPPVHG